MKATGRGKCACIAALILFPAALTLSATLVTAPGGNHAYYKKQVQVIDWAGFGKAMPVADLMIPTDWKFQGDVHWANRGCFTDLAAVTFRTQSPDGHLVFEAFPSFSWQFVSDQTVQRYLMMENRDGAQVGLKPCPVVPPAPAADLLRKRMLSQLRPGKEIAAMEPIPDLDQLMKDRERSVEEQSARTGPSRDHSARALLKYDLDGHPVEEWVMATGRPCSTCSPIRKAN